MFTRDIHSNNENINTALYDLTKSIEMCRKSKEKLLCIIVGYGSTGKTHKIKNAVENELISLKNQHKIKDFIFGNDLDIFSSKYQSFKYSHIIPADEKNKRNAGAVYIVL